MALFGGDMQQVETPDGRQITVPLQLAQAFPGLKPFAPPEVAQPPELPVVPPFVPQPSDHLPPPPEPPAAVAQSAPRGPVTQPDQIADGGPPQQTVKPVTNAQLAKMGEAGAANIELDAQNAQRAAVAQQGKVLADQATAMGQQMEQANAEADRLLEERRQYAEKRAAELQTATDSLMREGKAIADIRVDRSVDHPVLAALSSALIGIGQAMNKQPIDAMSAVYKAIDRKVAGQMAELDNRRANYAMQKDALGLQRQAGRDRLDEMDAHRLAYIEQAKRQLEEIKQKTSSDVIRGNTAVLQAELDKESAKTIGVAQDRFAQRQDAKEARAQQMQMHREQLDLGYAQMDSANARAILEREAEAQKLAAKGQTDRAQLVLERGIGGEANLVEVPAEENRAGESYLDRDGKRYRVDQGLMRLKNGEVFIPQGTTSSVSELQKFHPVSSSLVGTIDQILREGPEWLLDTANTDKKQRLDALFSAAKTQATTALGLGVPTGRDIELATGSLGTTDPTRFKDSLAGLKQARDNFVRSHSERLKSAGYDREWQPANLGKRGATEMPGDSELKSIQRAPSSRDWKAAFGGDPYASPRTFKGEPTDGPSNPAKRWIAEHGEITPNQISMIDQHGDALKASDPEARRKAGAWLEQVAKTGGTPAIRQYATQKLTNAVSTYAGELQSTETGPPTGQSVARETIPAVRAPVPKKSQRRVDSAGNPY